LLVFSALSCYTYPIFYIVKQEKLMTISPTLTTLSDRFDPKPDCWIGNHPEGDTGEEFCHHCCKQAVATLNMGFDPDDKKPLSLDQRQTLIDEPAIVDGGWRSEYDNPPHCCKCGVALTGSLLDSAISAELTHFEENTDPIIITDPQDAYLMTELLSACEQGQYQQRGEIIAARIQVSTC
jgi:hypothetical protein